MKYYFSKTIEGSFEEALSKVTESLKKQGFGILTEIDIQTTMKKKLGVDFAPYKILGACNPHFAYKALQKENKIGTMLPCNVIVQLVEGGKIEVAAIDPAASMIAVENEALGDIANEVRTKLKSAIDEL